jgi:hypothetical protein
MQPSYPALPVSPQTPECLVIAQGPGGRPSAEKWLTSWEDRLKMREQALIDAGYEIPRFRGTPVLNVSCCKCKKVLSDHGMQACYSHNTELDVYTTDRKPAGVKVLDYDVQHGMCRCQIREFQCSCEFIVGHYIRHRCEGCSAASDEGHRWFFPQENVLVEPRQDDVTGGTLMWPGKERLSQQIFDEGKFYDENSILQLDGDAGNWGSPLADRNGRPQAAALKPSAIGNAVMTSKKEADLVKLQQRLTSWEDTLVQKEAAQFEAELQQGSQAKYLRDCGEAQERTDRELRSREVALNKRVAAIEAHERQLQEQATSQTFLHDKVLQDLKRSLERAETKIAIGEAEADALRVQIAEQNKKTSAAEAKVASQSAEIQQLHNSLAEARRDARNLPIQPSGRGRLPPADEASSATSQRLSKRIQELEQEGNALRAELRKVSQQLQSKDAELVVARSQHSQGRDADLVRSRREVDITQVELEAAREEVLRLKLEIDRSRADASRNAAAATASAPDEFVQARLDIAEKLANKRADLERREVVLERREEAVAAREMALVTRERSFPLPVASSHDAARIGSGLHSVPHYYACSGVPEQPGGGGIAGLFKRITG